MMEWTKEKKLGVLSGPVLVYGGAYSNLQALQAVRTEAERLGIPPQNVICCGDTPGYCADPAACLDLTKDWGVHAIAGNVETNLVAGRDDCGCGFGDGSRCDMFARLWYSYAANNIDQRNRDYMAELPDVLRFQYAGREVVVLHGSPRNQSEFVWRSTPEALKAQFAAAAGADVVIGGHCGLPFGHEFPRLGIGPSSEQSSSTNTATGHSGTPAAGLDNSHRPQADALWLNAGVIGMPANDGTPRTWFMTLDDTNGFDFNFLPLHYDHQGAKARMLDDRRLPVSYAATLTTGVWDNTEIMPAQEEAREGVAIISENVKAEAFTGDRPSVELRLEQNDAPAPIAIGAPLNAPAKTKIQLSELHQKNKTMSTYSDPKDLRTFGKITEWQEEMGNKFFDWYGSVTEGDSALTAREKALIALAVSHAIQCSYCIDAYTTNSLQAGADEEQMMEAVHVAAAVKAGTTLIYARQMQKQVDKVTM